MKRRRWVLALLLAVLAIAAALYLIDAALKARPLKAAVPPDAWVVYTGDIARVAEALPESWHQAGIPATTGGETDAWIRWNGRQVVASQSPRHTKVSFTVPGLWATISAWNQSPVLPADTDVRRAGYQLALRRRGAAVIAVSDTLQILQQTATRLGQGIEVPSNTLLAIETPLSSNGVHAVLQLDNLDKPAFRGVLAVPDVPAGRALEARLGSFDFTLSAGNSSLFRALWQAMEEWDWSEYREPEAQAALDYWLGALSNREDAPIALGIDGSGMDGIQSFAILGAIPPENAIRIPMEWAQHGGFALSPGPWGNAAVCAETRFGWLVAYAEAEMPAALAALDAATLTESVVRLSVGDTHDGAIPFGLSELAWRIVAEPDAALPPGHYRLRAGIAELPMEDNSSELPPFLARSASAPNPTASAEREIMYRGWPHSFDIDPSTGSFRVPNLAFNIETNAAEGGTALGYENGEWRCETAQGNILVQRFTLLPDQLGALVTWDYESAPMEPQGPLRVSVSPGVPYVAGIVTPESQTLCFFVSGNKALWASAGLEVPDIEAAYTGNLLNAQFNTAQATGIALDKHADPSEWKAMNGPQGIGIALIHPPASLLLQWYKPLFRGRWQDFQQELADLIEQADAPWRGIGPAEAVRSFRKYGVEPDMPPENFADWMPSALYSILEVMEQVGGPSARQRYLEAWDRKHFGRVEDTLPAEQQGWLTLAYLRSLRAADGLYSTEATHKDLMDSAWQLARGRAGGSSALLATTRRDDAGRTDVSPLLLAHYALEQASAYVAELEGEAPAGWEERLREMRTELAATLVGGPCCVSLPSDFEAALRSPSLPYAVLRGLAELPACEPAAVYETTPRDRELREAAEAILDAARNEKTAAQSPG
ncbi:MAG: hypothetical protein GC168_08050 [Candidatus Hydrogenedens sp.]|nr:hypothetical protein [Candidatus Hydrogenedens sp.]